MKENWTYKKLGDCLSYVKNGVNIKQTKGAVGIPITRIETLSGGVFNRDRLGYANILSAEKYSQNILDDGDILMSHINSKAYIGRSVLYRKKDDEQIIHGMNLLRLKVVRSIVLPSYLNIFFQSDYFRDRVAKIRKDAVNQSSMAISDLVKIPIPIPPMEEQEKIVAELDLLQSVIDKKKAQLDEYDKLAQSIFYEMFGDPIDNPKKWEVKKLGEIGECISGGTPSRKRTDYFSGNINWFSAGELNSLFLTDSVEKITQEALDSSAAKLCKPMSLFIGMYDTAAFKLGIPTIESTSNQACANVSLYQDNIIWFYYVLLLMKDEALKHRHGARQKNLNLNYIKNFEIPLPPLSLQQSFAEKIEAIEHQKELVKQSLNEVKTLFDSRMDYYFN